MERQSANQFIGDVTDRSWTRRRVLLTLGLMPLAWRTHTAKADAAYPIQQHKVISRWIKIPASGVTLPAFLARPERAGRYRGIVLGADPDKTLEQRCAEAKALARRGQVVIVPDFTRESAGQRASLAAVRDYLIQHPWVQPS